MDAKLFKKAGFTEGETKVYLALLELGLSTTGPIVKKSGIAKSIVYQILENLMKKGLVSYIIKSKTKYFQAGDPDKILDYINKQENELQKIKKDFEKFLPELLAKQFSAEKSEATVYLGFKGLRTVHEHTYNKLKRGETYYYFGIPAFQPKEQHLYWQKDHIKRIKKGIKCKTLFNQDTDKKVLKNRNSFKDLDARYMPQGIKTPALFLVYKDTTVIMLQHPSRIAVEIINQDIADSFQSYFDEFWKRSEKFNN